jgi:hypothetical protein
MRGTEMNDTPTYLHFLSSFNNVSVSFTFVSFSPSLVGQRMRRNVENSPFCKRIDELQSQPLEISQVRFEGKVSIQSAIGSIGSVLL